MSLIAVASSLVVLFAVSEGKAAGPDPESTNRPLVYSQDPNDPWNKLYEQLFVRTVDVRFSAELQGRSSSPMTTIRAMGFPDGLQVTADVQRLVEDGDRASDPLYPTTLPSVGLGEALSDRRYPTLKAAVLEVLEEGAVRPPLLRAIMQADVWAAHDLLVMATTWTRSKRVVLVSRAAELQPLFAQLVKKLALSPQEIAALPDNYSMAADVYPLPAVFDGGGDWIEISSTAPRSHDRAMHLRRAARIFVRPSSEMADPQRLLEALSQSGAQVEELAAAALVMQILLVDTEGRVVPSPLIQDVQIRAFHRDTDGEIIRTALAQYEMSRRLLVAGMAGGLVALDDRDAVYLPFSGNDFGFATPFVREAGGPVRVALRQKCGVCHGAPMASRTFSFHPLHGSPPGQIQPLQTPNQAQADLVAREKMLQRDFARLME